MAPRPPASGRALVDDQVERRRLLVGKPGAALRALDDSIPRVGVRGACARADWAVDEGSGFHELFERAPTVGRRPLQREIPQIARACSSMTASSDCQGSWEFSRRR
jgi:hypothetical protein